MKNNKLSKVIKRENKGIGQRNFWMDENTQNKYETLDVSPRVMPRSHFTSIFILNSWIMLFQTFWEICYLSLVVKILL